MTNMAQPLAARMRPTSLDEIVGQDHLVYDGSPLSLLADGKSRSSVLLYGPPGTGKTSIARVIAASTDQRFVELSATSAGVKQVRDEIAAAVKVQQEDNRVTVLFLDEIHRFSKAQQDVLLDAVEHGKIALIAATTENPSFSVNSALVSRSVLMVLEPIGVDSITTLLGRAIDDPRGLDGTVTASAKVLERIASLSSGDVRQALGRLEVCAETALAAGHDEITLDTVATVAGNALQRFDRDGDQHYDVVSAFIKSMRGSDPDGTIYWLARMIAAGEDPRFIARRIMIHASEDVGMADPMAIIVAEAAAGIVERVGMPEARITLAQAALHIATAPKSPASYQAIGAALKEVEAAAGDQVPVHLRDAHYPGAAALGHGAGYRYPHDWPNSVVDQEYLPERLRTTRFYHPRPVGHEAHVATYLDLVAQIKDLQAEKRQREG